MSDSVTVRQLRRRFGKPALFGALGLMLAGCAAADAPLPFITSPDPETTATVTPADASPAAHVTTPNGTAPHDATPAHAPETAQTAGAKATGTTAAGSTATGTTSAGAASHPPVHSPARQDLPFPSFSTPAAAGDRPVLNDKEKAKMQSDLEGLAKSRETKMRQDIEQAQ